MLVMDASIWPYGDKTNREHLGRLGVARIDASAGGDLSDHLYVVVDDKGIHKSGIVRRHAYQDGWMKLVSRCLDGGNEAAPDEQRRAVIQIATLLTDDGGEERDR